MWFTRVSLKNPVFATMVMLAIVVLGLFSYQRLNIDQFPNIEFPVVVVQTDYPGASPEIVESEVSKRVEEAVNVAVPRPLDILVLTLLLRLASLAGGSLAPFLPTDRT